MPAGPTTPTESACLATRTRRNRAERERWARKVADAHPDPASMTVAELAEIVDRRVAEVCR